MPKRKTKKGEENFSLFTRGVPVATFDGISLNRAVSKTVAVSFYVVGVVFSSRDTEKSTWAADGKWLLECMLFSYRTRV